jgi:hypothetical protein
VWYFGNSWKGKSAEGATLSYEPEKMKLEPMVAIAAGHQHFIALSSNIF